MNKFLCKGGCDFTITHHYLAIFVLFDILFFPRLVFAFGIPASLAIVFIFFVNSKVSRDSILCMMALTITMVASVLFGVLSGGNVNPGDSIKRLFQLLTIILYAFFTFDSEKIRQQLVMLFRIFYCYIFGLMLIFFSFPELYLSFISNVYPEAKDQLENTVLIFRFAYLYSDPNSAGYLICISLVGYMKLERNKSFALIFAMLATSVVLATQSRGAYIALILIFTSLLFSSSITASKKILMFAILAFVIGCIFYLFNEQIQFAYDVFETRLSEEEAMGEGVGGGRIGRYMYFIENFNILPLGTGYNLTRDGIEFKPHSDFIRMNLSYGIFSLPLLLYFFAPRQRSQVLLFAVFLVPFMINTVIDDYRLSCLYLLLLGIIARASDSDDRL